MALYSRLFSSDVEPATKMAIHRGLVDPPDPQPRLFAIVCIILNIGVHGAVIG